MSVSTLRRHFKIVFGQNIHEYFQKKKMIWAKIQLEKGEKNITEIARALGFVKPANFSKAFKKEFGILPKKIKDIITTISLLFHDLNYLMFYNLIV